MAEDWALELANRLKDKAALRKGRTETARARADHAAGAGPGLFEDLQQRVLAASRLVFSKSGVRITVSDPERAGEGLAFAAALKGHEIRVVLLPDGVVRIAEDLGEGHRPYAFLVVEQDRFGRARVRVKRTAPAGSRAAWTTADDAARDLLSRLVDRHGAE
ncbi:MAG: hypothetical protein HY722_13530 [Planctomycetes bacterium]|nr:hypothetical protein [Planctomycetota bacterium]